MNTKISVEPPRSQGKSAFPNVELVISPDCPNVAAAREQLLRAFSAAGMSSRWREWDSTDAATPEILRRYGSPTLLINGRELYGVKAADADCCRVYENPGARGVPALDDIVAALQAGVGDTGVSRAGLAALPALGAALVPKVVCPACWPAYTGLMSALGIGFVDYTPWLLPATGSFLLLVLGALAWRARERHGFGPLWLGLVASGLILAGKFRFENDAMLWAGVVLLVGATLWNVWPTRQPPPCPACKTT